MSYSRRSRYSHSPSPYRRESRSMSRSRSHSRSRSQSSDVENPGNNLYVTGLSPRITKREVEKHFSTAGKVIDVHLVVDPWTRESRGFGFVTMASVKEADRCIKSLDRSVLEGRVIAVEKARRRRGRTPTPGRYMGLRKTRVRQRTPSYSPIRRSPSYSSDRGRRSRSHGRSYDRRRSRSYSPDNGRRRSYSPYYSRDRSNSPYYSRRRSSSPYYGRRRSYSRSRSPHSRSPDDRYYGRRERSYSPCDSRYYDCFYRRRDRSYTPYNYPDDRYYRRHRYCSISRSPTPLRSSRRSYSRTVTPKRRTSSRWGHSRSISPRPRSTRRSYSRSVSPRHRKCVSCERYSRSPSVSCRSISRSVGSRSASPSS